MTDLELDMVRFLNVLLKQESICAQWQKTADEK